MSRFTGMMIALLSTLLLPINTVHSHHAMEYIEMESYSTAAAGEFVFHIHYDYMVDDADNPLLDHWEITPGLAYGLHDRLMFDIHTHFAKFGGDHIQPDAGFGDEGASPFMEAAAATLHLRLLEGWMIDAAATATVEVPFSRAGDLLGSEDNVYAGSLIVSKDFGEHRNVTLNAGYEREGEESAAYLAAGIKTPLSADRHGIAGGVEFCTDFDGEAWSVLSGIYAPLGSDSIVLKTGLEFGRSDEAATLRASLSLMYSF